MKMVDSKNLGVIQRKKKYPESYDEYLEIIYRISLKNPKGWVKNNEIAARLNVKASSVSNMLAKLKKPGLIDWQPRGGIRLSKKGRIRAKNIIRNHIIIELFLDTILNIKDRDEIERITCNLEHYFTEELVQGFIELMGIEKDQIQNMDNLILEDKFPEKIKAHPIYSEKIVISILMSIQNKLKTESSETVSKTLSSVIKKRNFQMLLD